MLRALIVEGWMAQLLGVLLIAALLSARPRSTANRLLAVGLFCAVYRQFLLTLQFSGAITSLPILFRTSLPFQMLAIPLYYLYAKALTTPEFKLERKHALHLIPCFIGLAWTLVMWVRESTSLVQPGASSHLESYIQVVVKVLVVIPYLIQTHRQVRSFAQQSKHHLSNLAHLKLRWLSTLLLVIYFMLGVDTLDVVTGPGIPVWYLLPPAGLMALITLAYFSLRVSPVFARETRYQETIPTTDLPAAELKKDTGRLSDEQLERQKKRLIEVLQAQTLYLNPELRLSDVATALDIRPYRVSEVLSRGMQTTFYDLINRYRVDQARKLLSSPDSGYLNLLGVAMESGFKSKSVFNDVFKKTTGMTPSEFRTSKMTESPHPDD